MVTSNSNLYHRSVERLELEVEVLEHRASAAEVAEAELVQELRQYEAAAADRHAPMKYGAS